MRRWVRAAIALMVVLAVAGLGIFFFVAPAMVERAMNAVIEPPPYTVAERAAALHETLRVADLHADSLLWGRDLNRRGTRAQVDVPRLVEGNVAVQVFAVVSKTPRSMNIDQNTGDTDNITLLAIAQRWPVRTWTSLKERALYQAERMHAFAAQSNGRLTMIRTRGDLERFLERRRSEPDIVAGVLALEGSQVLEGDPANVDVMFEAGYRMMSPTHFFDTEMAGSAHGVSKGGLTPAGREMIARMEKLGMIVDVSHGSAAQIDDVLAMATKPVVVSHTGVRGTCDNGRNLTDDQLRAIRDTDGMVGLNFATGFLRPDGRMDVATDIDLMLRHLDHMIEVAGETHVGLGSDFDGAAIPATIGSAAGLPQLFAALARHGYDRPLLERLAHGNWLSLLERTID
jgi:microsomal dipeptidase-like Zn-dependent dipeptidase